MEPFTAVAVLIKNRYCAQSNVPILLSVITYDNGERSFKVICGYQKMLTICKTTQTVLVLVLLSVTTMTVVFCVLLIVVQRPVLTLHTTSVLWRRRLTQPLSRGTRLTTTDKTFTTYSGMSTLLAQFLLIATGKLEVE